MNKESSVQGKREVREFCFQYFFHLQLPIFEELRVALKSDQTDALEHHLQNFAVASDFSYELKNKEKVKSITIHALSNYDDIKSRIERFLKNWKFSRLSKVDQTILILGFSELIRNQGKMYKVIINESIEIAKKYGSAESSKFINGVLDNFFKSESQLERP